MKHQYQYKYNQLFNTVLTIGQQLIIPIEKKSNYSNNDISYIVQKGDSLYSIASINNTTVNTRTAASGAQNIIATNAPPTM